MREPVGRGIRGEERNEGRRKRMGGAAAGGIYEGNSKRGKQDAVPRCSSDAEAQVRCPERFVRQGMCEEKMRGEYGKCRRRGCGVETSMIHLERYQD